MFGGGCSSLGGGRLSGIQDGGGLGGGLDGVQGRGVQGRGGLGGAFGRGVLSGAPPAVPVGRGVFWAAAVAWVSRTRARPATTVFIAARSLRRVPDRGRGWMGIFFCFAICTGGLALERQAASPRPLEAFSGVLPPTRET